MEQSTAYRFEPARSADLDQLATIERAAAALFSAAQLPLSARLETTSIAELQSAHAAGLVWVARAPSGEVVGFALLEALEAGLHLEEIDVHPAHGRRGVGRALLQAVLDWARAAGHPWMTLTTFHDVAFNGPFYQSMGFRALEASEITPELQSIVDDETARGLDAARRVVMRRDLR